MNNTIIREFNEREREAMRMRLALIPTIIRSLGCLIFSLTITGILAYGVLQKEGRLWTGLAFILVLILMVAFLWLVSKSAIAGAISIVSLISAAVLVHTGLQEGGWLLSELSGTIKWVWTGLTIISTLILAGVLYQVAGDLRWRRLEWDEKKQKITEAIEHNRVEVMHLKPSAAVSVYDYSKDEEIACFYDIANKHILCIQWRWLRRVPTDWDWPNDCFELVLTTKHKLVVGIFCYGEKLQSIRHVDFDHHLQDEASKLFGNLPSHPIMIFEGYLDNLEEVVKKEPIEVWN